MGFTSLVGTLGIPETMVEQLRDGTCNLHQPFTYKNNKVQPNLQKLVSEPLQGMALSEFESKSVST